LGRKFSEWVQVPRVATSPHSYEVVLPAKDERSERFLVVTETRLTSSAPSGECTLCVVRDLTERVAAEQRHRRLELDLERNQALQGLAVLAGGVAHDFNNLLGGVVGNAELALRKLPSGSPPKVQECLTEIKAFAKEAAALSRQMLAYAGRRSLAIAVFDVNQEIAEALRLVRTTVAARAQLQCDLADERSSNKL
jgi:signal transduction histidine kinase